MYIKLSIRNLKRSIGDYCIYFFSLTVLAAVNYAFFSLSFSKAILSLSENLYFFSDIVKALTAIIIFVATIIVQYSVSFIFQQRKNELAIYSLLGMNGFIVFIMFFFEHIVLGALAFFLGVMLGNTLSTPLSFLIINMLQAEGSYDIRWSPQALVYTGISFAFYYLLGAGRIIFIASSKTIVQLFMPLGAIKPTVSERLDKIFFILSILFILLGFWGIICGFHNDQKSMILFFLGFLFIFTGIFLFYRNIYACLNFFEKLINNWKYKGINLYLWKQIAGRLSINSRQNGLIALLVMLVVGGMSLSFAMSNIYYVNLDTFYPYDIEVVLDTVIPHEEMLGVKKFISQSIELDDYQSYYLYKSKNVKTSTILCLSDYNFLRRQIGLPDKRLADNQFIIHCEERKFLDVIYKEISKVPNIMIGDTLLTTESSLVYTEAMEQVKAAGMNGYTIVVPDHCKKDLEPVATRLIMTAKSEVPMQLKQKLEYFMQCEWEGRNRIEQSGQEHIYFNIVVKSWSLRNSMAGYTMIAFGGLYFSIAMMVLLGNSISFQQLSNVKESIKNYKILYSLGVTWEEWTHIVRTELCLRFFFPLVVPETVTILLLLLLQYQYRYYILSDQKVILLSGLAAFCIFLLIYILYLMGTILIYIRIMKKILAQDIKTS